MLHLTSDLLQVICSCDQLDIFSVVAQIIHLTKDFIGSSELALSGQNWEKKCREIRFDRHEGHGFKRVWKNAVGWDENSKVLMNNIFEVVKLP